jgi:hypothetical protein
LRNENANLSGCLLADANRIWPRPPRPQQQLVATLSSAHAKSSAGGLGVHAICAGASSLLSTAISMELGNETFTGCKTAAVSGAFGPIQPAANSATAP